MTEKCQKKMSFDLFGEDDEDDSLFHPKPPKERKDENQESETKLPDLPFFNNKEETQPKSEEKTELIEEKEQNEQIDDKKPEKSIKPEINFSSFAPDYYWFADDAAHSNDVPSNESHRESL